MVPILVAGVCVCVCVLYKLPLRLVCQGTFLGKALCCLVRHFHLHTSPLMFIHFEE